MDFHPCLRIQPSSSDLTLQPSPDALRLARAYRTRGSAGACRVKTPERVREEATAGVLQGGGDPACLELVLSESELQFGQYQDQTLKWLLSHDVGHDVGFRSSQSGPVFYEQVVKEKRLTALYCEFINRVDVNRGISHPYTQSLVQYVCGLGPRKGSHLLKILKQNNTRLEKCTQLVTLCHMGPKVTDSYIEVLDGSGVHPETYEWARKMAVDALEYDESAEDANQARALEENPEHLKDLDAFAKELERQGYGNKGITLYDIRAELSCRYKDLRVPYRAPNTEEVFNLLTKETPETFYKGKLITSCVTGIAHRRPQRESYDQAIRNDATGLWQCPFCQRDNFPELSEVRQPCSSVTRWSNTLRRGSRPHVRPGGQGQQVEAPQGHYDFDTESEDHKHEEELNKKQQRTLYIKRVIAHPSFHNINFKQAEKMMESLDQGDLVIRPSSNGENHLTVTWKVLQNT
ncbi:unnamed protein product [Lota lota]